MIAADGFALIGLGVELGRLATPAEACGLLVKRLEAMLGVPCEVRARNDGDWHTIARAGGPGAIEEDTATRITIPGAEGARELVIAARDWQDPAWVEGLQAVISSAFQLVALKVQRAETVRRHLTLGEFLRALLGTSDSAGLSRAIVDHMGRAVGAEIGALAVLIPQENSLAITATRGYPLVLVEHVRLTPGEGVMGRVFVTGDPIICERTTAQGGQVARRRYRTDSYVALPLSGPDGIVAVVSFTDKENGAAFTESDLALLQQLAMPAALALSRDLLRARTHDLAHLATVDALTGLFNRRYFETRLEQELQRQRRQFDDLSLLMLDLDNFKELNDTQGHPVGDMALREVAEILRRAVRIFDVCARYGGEEFVILMPGAGASTAQRIAERIRRQVEQHFAIGLRSGVPVRLTVSIGVSTATPSVIPDVLIRQADTALLHAKATGKNQVSLHEGARL